MHLYRVREGVVDDPRDVSTLVAGAPVAHDFVPYVVKEALFPGALSGGGSHIDGTITLEPGTDAARSYSFSLTSRLTPVRAALTQARRSVVDRLDLATPPLVEGADAMPYKDTIIVSSALGRQYGVAPQLMGKPY